MAKTRLSFFLLILFLCLASGFSQQFEDNENDENDKSNRIDYAYKFGLTPSALFNKYTAFEINGGIVLSDHFQFILETGWIFYSITSNENSISGYRLRPSFRYYFNTKQKYPFHISVGYNIRKTTAIRIEEFFVPTELNTNIKEFEHDRLKKGFVLMAGIDLYLARNFIVDVGFGVGYGTLEVDDREIPDNGFRLGPYRDIYDSPGIYNQRIWIFNLKFQFLL